MHAVRVHEHGGPEVMRLEELPLPEPRRGEALIRVVASGVNFLDIRHRTGDFKTTLPITLGVEGAGVVDAVGNGVSDVRVGDRVAWQMQQGSYATHAIVPVNGLVPIPDAIDTHTAAAVLLQGLTANALASSAYELSSNETCLVHAAAGGVGGLLCQIAKHRGARVIGTVSRAGKVDMAREAGADEVLVRTETDFVSEAKQLTGGRGVDVVYDGIGKDTLEQGLQALRPLGYMVLYGQASGAVEPFDTHLLQANGGRYLTRVSVLNHAGERGQLLGGSSELFEWIAAGKLHVRIARSYPLAEAGRAHAEFGAARTTGKLLLEIG